MVRVVSLFYSSVKNLERSNEDMDIDLSTTKSTPTLSTPALKLASKSVPNPTNVTSNVGSSNAISTKSKKSSKNKQRSRQEIEELLKKINQNDEKCIDGGGVF